MDEALSRWLRLREPCDIAARSEALTRAIAETLPVEGPVCVLDLATGEGSNIRFLAGRLPGPQRWLAVDRSPTLLRGLCERMSSWGEERGYTVQTDADGCRLHGADIECDVETRQVDLGALDRHDIFAGRHLVTASALLDLVSTQWLRALVAHCQRERASALFTISYNGDFSCAPAEAEDGLVRDLMNEHQKTDKGLGGPATGPDAVTRAVRCFAEAGYHVQCEPSDWALGPAEQDVQRALVDGWAEAATEIAPDRTSTIADWRARRLAHVEAGRSRVIVGHDDLAAWLPHG
jgi:hypothetical protein